MSFCNVCGKEIPPGASFCPSCGAQVVTSAESVAVPVSQQDTMPLKKKSVMLATVLGFLVAGLGHFYLGKWKRGGLWVIGALILWAMIVYTSPSYLLTAGLIIGIFSAFDARKTALKKYS